MLLLCIFLPAPTLNEPRFMTQKANTQNCFHSPSLAVSGNVVLLLALFAPGLWHLGATSGQEAEGHVSSESTMHELGESSLLLSCSFHFLVGIMIVPSRDSCKHFLQVTAVAQMKLQEERYLS